MPGYVGFYRGKRAECHAETKYKAQLKLGLMLGARKRYYDVAVEIAETEDGKQVVHDATE